MREKKRYLLVEVNGPKVDDKTAKHVLYEAVFQLLGEAGAAEASFQFKEFNPSKQLAIVKCKTVFLERVIASLALKRYWHGGDVALRVKKISGMISKL